MKCQYLRNRIIPYQKPTGKVNISLLYCPFAEKNGTVVNKTHLSQCIHYTNFIFFRNSVVVFDEAHNIDNTCIDSMSVKINRKLLDKCQNSITVLEEEIQRLKSEDSSRLREEYDKLVAGNILFKY